MIPERHAEQHLVQRIGWLRASILGANDGIVSTASLIVGVASATPSSHAILVASLAGIIAGAMSMAAGEYVSVSSQADTEKNELEREKRELAQDPESELEELTRIYISRGVREDLAREVSRQMMLRDALGAHARDELGLSELSHARPLQAALASAASFVFGAALPFTAALLSPVRNAVPVVFVCALAALALLGGIGATTGGAPITTAVIRVTFWGALAMAVTSGIGRLIGVNI